MHEHNSRGATYGLRADALSPMEILAQSVSTIAPTTTPVATIPLVCALSGNGTWLAYVLATIAILLVGQTVMPGRGNRDPGQMTGLVDTATLIDRLRADGVVLTYDPQDQTLRAGGHDTLSVTIGKNR